MTPQEAIPILKRLQEPEPWEPQISRDAFEALELAIEALEDREQIFHLECLRCKKPVGTYSRQTMEQVSYTHYSYCEDCLRKGLKMLKKQDALDKQSASSVQADKKLFGHGYWLMPGEVFISHNVLNEVLDTLAKTSENNEAIRIDDHIADSDKMVDQFRDDTKMTDDVPDTNVEKIPYKKPEIIRCKDCQYRDPEDKKCDHGHGIVWQLPRPDDWFCADGKA